MKHPAERYLKTYALALQWCERVEACLAQLPDRERILLEGRYCVGLRVPFSEMEDELSIARSGVYRIRIRALKNIWRLFQISQVPFFWDDICEQMSYNTGGS